MADRHGRPLIKLLLDNRCDKGLKEFDLRGDNHGDLAIFSPGEVLRGNGNGGRRTAGGRSRGMSTITAVKIKVVRGSGGVGQGDAREGGGGGEGESVLPLN